MKNPPLHRYATRPGLYFTDDGGADAVVRSETADQVWFCVLEPLDQPSAFYADAARLFNEPGLTFIDQAKKQRICTRRIPSLNLRETLFRMDGPNYGLWYVHVPQAWDGMQYGYRVNGPWDPNHGVSFNPYKLLLDPYAKGIEGSMKLDPGAFAYECEIVNGKVKGSPFGPMSTIDSVGRMPVSVAIDDRAIDKHVGEPSHPHVPWSKTVIYELHVKGFTANAPWLPKELRGTYAGLAHPATLSYLQDLGVTSIELLPIQAKQSELFLQERNRTNYWGYSTLGYFAPEASYATKQAQEAGAGAVRQEVIDMVRAMHEAGFEVIMDVVYNHTCESGPKARPFAGEALTISRTTDAPKTRSAACTTPPVAATRLISPTRTSPRSPWIRCAIGPNALVSTDSDSILRRRWRVLTANSRDTTRSCTRCAPICCSATSR